ncbi:MAG: NACHT domain-containing protein [Hormoscilla sp. SP12CHS1]|nr:NACHT domain-containing protein [Hormoscilla sp. SP12CHS1]
MKEKYPIYNKNKAKLQEKGVVNQGTIQEMKVVITNQTPPEQPLQIDWQKICREMMERRLTTNSLFHDEEAKKEREQIYVPLALVEGKKTDKRKEEEESSPDRGSKLYEPEYEEKQRFQHSAFLQQILQQGKTQGRRIALIGEPGAGKTTLLQKIADWIEEQKLGLPLWVSLADLTTEGSLQDFDTYLLGPWLRKAVSEDGARQDFQRQFEERRVWLLLDGVDEVATSGVETLGSIAKQLVGWVGKARVVLTCRLNV